MLKLTEVVHHAETPAATLTLPFDLRQKTRLRTQLDNGVEVALQIKRGTILRGGDYIKSEEGTVVLVKAASEHVSTAYVNDTLSLAKACYHLGNRHVPLQIGSNWVRYQHDHVLDHMLEEMGLSVLIEDAPFEPESGAYHNDSHAHEH